MRTKIKRAGALLLLLIAVLGTALPAAAEEAALLRAFQAMVSENPDMDVEVIVDGIFLFAEGESAVSLSTHSRYTHDPMAFFTDVGFHSFSSVQEAKTVCMPYRGEYVMYAWNDVPGGKRLKRKTTEDTLAGMLNGLPIVAYLAGVANRYESAASFEEGAVAIRLSPQEAGAFLRDSGLSLGSIAMEAAAEEPVALLFVFAGDTDQISEIRLSCPTTYEYQGMRVEGSVSLLVRFLQIGRVDPIEMPEEADTVPFS